MSKTKSSLKKEPQGKSKSEDSLLNKEFLTRVEPAIRKTWSIIGSDVEEAARSAEEELTNESAIETTIDANYITTHGQDAVADKLISAVYMKTKGGALLKFLSDNIQLV